MAKQTEITISGVGGQGTILCGTMIAEAAILHEHRHATLTSEYGVETRGTFAKSDVIVSQGDIYFPDVTEPDLVICLAQVAYNRYSGNIPADATIIYNSAEITPNPEHADQEKGVDLTHLSRKIGNPAVANIITLGIIVGYLGVVTTAGAKDSVREFFGKKGDKILQMNYKAFDTGYEIGRNMRAGA